MNPLQTTLLRRLRLHPHLRLLGHALGLLLVLW